jgi:VIT1/CCC1 family predicted Fe2+/Mn2+ transporter
MNILLRSLWKTLRYVFGISLFIGVLIGIISICVMFASKFGIIAWYGLVAISIIVFGTYLNYRDEKKIAQRNK